MTEFRSRIEEEIPRLRRYARALTRNGSRCDDLVQDTRPGAREGTPMAVREQYPGVAFHHNA